MTILDDIVADKSDIITRDRQLTSLEKLKAQIAEMQESQTHRPRGFADTIKNQPAPTIISEIKKQSPSHGLIRSDFDVVHIAEQYAKAGAACLSILTDEKYFGGEYRNIMCAREAVNLPILRKDFIIDPYQIYQSRALGADCILLIVAILSDAQLNEFYQIAAMIGLDILIEIHDEAELHRALKLKPKMLGINNRNLKTLETNLETCKNLANLVPDDCLMIGESGLNHAWQLYEISNRKNNKRGADGFLIGESLMRQENIYDALKTLIDDYRRLEERV